MRYLFESDSTQERFRSFVNPDLYNIYREAVFNGIKYHSTKTVPYDRLREFVSHIGFIFDINSPIIYDYLYYTEWIQKYIAPVKEHMSGENLEKIKAIEGTCLNYLFEKSTKNKDAINIGYKQYKKK